MNYPCNLIQDLLPLYLDGVCSEESKTVVEQHLIKCPNCRKYYSAMRESDEIIIMPPNAEREIQKATSFQSVKKTLFRKQILIAAVSIIVLAVIAFAVISVLKNSVGIVEYEDNISVSMIDGSLVGRLNGSQETYIKIIRTTIEADGQEENYLFYYLSDTKWNDLTTSRQVFSEYVLCPMDKGADQIDRVYYYTGDYTGIETMGSDKLQEIINASVLLWSR
jgi:hypothetical protein